MRDPWNTVWEFRTRRLLVTLDVTPEEAHPRDRFEFEEGIEAVESGAVEWFTARVAVHLLDADGARGGIIGADYLGGCAHSTFEDFYTSHRDADPMNRNCSLMRAARGENVVICHYFPGMVAEACGAARAALRALPKVRAA